jgi:mycothiol synthase
VKVRPLEPDDAGPVAAIVRADEEALRGRPSHVDAAEVASWWERTDLARHSWLFEENGTAVAVGWLFPYGRKAAFGGVVAQGSKGRGLGAAIVERAEATAVDHGLERMHTWVLPEDAAAVALFRSRGYEEVRRFFEMAIDLDAPPSDPVLSAGLLLDGFREVDARAFHAATLEAFEDHWEWHATPFDEWWEQRRVNDHSLWFVVRDGDEIAAIVRNERRENAGYVGIIGVRRPWRGLGLGKALMLRSFRAFWECGLRRITLHVDAASPTGATKLYESVGMRVESETATYER